MFGINLFQCTTQNQYAVWPVADVHAATASLGSLLTLAKKSATKHDVERSLGVPNDAELTVPVIVTGGIDPLPTVTAETAQAASGIATAGMLLLFRVTVPVRMHAQMYLANKAFSAAVPARLAPYAVPVIVKLHVAALE